MSVESKIKTFVSAPERLDDLVNPWLEKYGTTIKIHSSDFKINLTASAAIMIIWYSYVTEAPQMCKGDNHSQSMTFKQ